MSILVHAWTLAVRLDALEARFSGGVAALEATVPNSTYHRDEHLAAASFLALPDLLNWIGPLVEDSELKGYEDEGWHDLAALNPTDGLQCGCDWLTFAQHPDGYAYCWLAGTDPGSLAAWPGWDPKDALSLTSLLPDEVNEKLQPVTLWSETVDQAFAVSGVQAAVVKETGKVLYTSAGALGDHSGPRPETTASAGVSSDDLGPTQGVMPTTGVRSSAESTPRSMEVKKGKIRLLRHMMRKHGLWDGVQDAPNLHINTLGVWHLRDHLGDRVGQRFISNESRNCALCDGTGHILDVDGLLTDCDNCNGRGRLATLGHTHGNEVWDHATDPSQYQSLDNGGDSLAVPDRYGISQHLIERHGYQTGKLREPEWDQGDPLAILPTGRHTLEMETFGRAAAYQHETLHIIGPQAETNGARRQWVPHTHGGEIEGERPYEPSGDRSLRR
jgi:hypothetical protein